MHPRERYKNGRHIDSVLLVKQLFGKSLTLCPLLLDFVAFAAARV